MKSCQKISAVWTIEGLSLRSSYALSHSPRWLQVTAALFMGLLCAHPAKAFEFYEYRTLNNGARSFHATVTTGSSATTASLDYYSNIVSSTVGISAHDDWAEYNFTDYADAFFPQNSLNNWKRLTSSWIAVTQEVGAIAVINGTPYTYESHGGYASLEEYLVFKAALRGEVDRLTYIEQTPVVLSIPVGRDTGEIVAPHEILVLGHQFDPLTGREEDVRTYYSVMSASPPFPNLSGVDQYSINRVLVPEAALISTATTSGYATISGVLHGSVDGGWIWRVSQHVHVDRLYNYSTTPDLDRQIAGNSGPTLSYVVGDTGSNQVRMEATPVTLLDSEKHSGVIYTNRLTLADATVLVGYGDPLEIAMNDSHATQPQMIWLTDDEPGAGGGAGIFGRGSIVNRDARLEDDRVLAAREGSIRCRGTVSSTFTIGSGITLSSPPSLHDGGLIYSETGGSLVVNGTIENNSIIRGFDCVIVRDGGCLSQSNVTNSYWAPYYRLEDGLVSKPVYKSMIHGNAPFVDCLSLELSGPNAFKLVSDTRDESMAMPAFYVDALRVTDGASVRYADWQDYVQQVFVGTGSQLTAESRLDVEDIAVDEGGVVRFFSNLRNDIAATMSPITLVMDPPTGLLSRELSRESYEFGLVALKVKGDCANRLREYLRDGRLSTPAELNCEVAYDARSDATLLFAPFDRRAVTATGSVGQSDVGIGPSDISIQLVKTGSGTLVLDQDNAYFGGTFLSQGTLVAKSGSAFGLGAIKVSGGTLDLGSYSVKNDILISGGAITNAGNFAGTQSVAGVVSMTGTIGGTVNVATSGELKGSGVVFSGPVSLASGAQHSPGNSPGMQTFTAGLSYSTGSILNWELIANTGTGAGTNYDFLSVTGGSLSIASGALLNLAFSGSGSTVSWSDPLWNVDHTWTIIDALAATSSTGDFTLGTISNDSLGRSLVSVRPDAAFSVGHEGNNVVLTFTAVPEPSTSVLALAGLAYTGYSMWRRKTMQAGSDSDI